MESSTAIDIDGSVNEGGGQILRISLALSNILKKSFYISNIRKSRPNPGLNNQLLTVIKMMKNLFDSEIKNDKNGQLWMSYYPNMVKPGKYNCDCISAGSISLMIQSIIPSMMFCDKETIFIMKGGTNVNKSPPSFSIQNILTILLKEIGVNIEYNVKKEGYYPKGGGIAELIVFPAFVPLKNLNLVNPLKLNRIDIHIYHFNENIKIKDFRKLLKKEITRIQKTYFPEFKSDINNKESDSDEELKENNSSKENIPININLIQVPSHSKFKDKEFYQLVFHAFGDKNSSFFDCSYYPEDNEKINIEKALENSLEKLENYIKEQSCLDEHHQDQLFIYMALAKGISQIKIGKFITEHTYAAIYVIKQFLPKSRIEIKENVNDNGKIIEIKGIGWMGEKEKK